MQKLINIPISTDPNYLGNPLEVETTNGFISNIKWIIDHNVIDILSLIKEKSGYISKTTLIVSFLFILVINFILIEMKTIIYMF